MKRLAAALLASSLAMPALAAERTPQTNYVLRCLGCHLPDGTGMPQSGIPDFVGKVGVFAGLPEGRAYLLHVPGVVGASLTDKEIADLLNYIMDTWAGASRPANYKPFTASEVTQLRAQSVGNVVNYRRIVAAKLAEVGLSVADYPWP